MSSMPVCRHILSLQALKGREGGFRPSRPFRAERGEIKGEGRPPPWALPRAVTFQPFGLTCHFGSFVAPCSRFRFPGPPIPIRGRWPLQKTNDKGPMTVVPHSALWIFAHCPHNSLSRLGLQKRVSPGFRFPAPLLLIVYLSTPSKVIHNDVWPYVGWQNAQKPIKIDQNGIKFGSKNDQKRAQIVMPILTFWGVTPSGASARADLASRKGKKGAFSGRKIARSKVIHNLHKMPQGRQAIARQALNPGPAGPSWAGAPVTWRP